MFIGKTGRIHAVLQKKTAHVASGKATLIERRLMFTGPPGVAKSGLAEQWARELTGTSSHAQLEIQTCIGSALNADMVRQWMVNAHYRPMYAPVHVKIVNEIDTVTPTALNELRQYLDDLPPHGVFIATTNEPVKKLPAPLQSRFQVWQFDPVPAAEIAGLLVQTFALDAETAQRLAFGARGDVRAALHDAQAEVDARALLAA